MKRYLLLFYVLLIALSQGACIREELDFNKQDSYFFNPVYTLPFLNVNDRESSEYPLLISEGGQYVLADYPFDFFGEVEFNDNLIQLQIDYRFENGYPLPLRSMSIEMQDINGTVLDLISIENLAAAQWDGTTLSSADTIAQRLYSGADLENIMRTRHMAVSVEYDISNAPSAHEDFFIDYQSLGVFYLQYSSQSQ